MPPEPCRPSQLPPRLAELRAPSVEKPSRCRVIFPAFYLPPLFSAHNTRLIKGQRFFCWLFVTLYMLFPHPLPAPILFFSPRWWGNSISSPMTYLSGPSRCRQQSTSQKWSRRSWAAMCPRSCRAWSNPSCSTTHIRRREGWEEGWGDRGGESLMAIHLTACHQPVVLKISCKAGKDKQIMASVKFKSLHAPAYPPQGGAVRLQVHIGLKTSSLILSFEGTGSTCFTTSFHWLLSYKVFDYSDVPGLRHAYFFFLCTQCAHE